MLLRQALAATNESRSASSDVGSNRLVAHALARNLETQVPRAAIETDKPTQSDPPWNKRMENTAPF